MDKIRLGREGIEFRGIWAKLLVAVVLIFSLWQPIKYSIASVLVGVAGGLLTYLLRVFMKEVVRIRYSDGSDDAIEQRSSMGTNIALCVTILASLAVRDAMDHDGFNHLAVWQAGLLSFVVLVIVVVCATDRWYPVTHRLTSPPDDE